MTKTILFAFVAAALIGGILASSELVFAAKEDNPSKGGIPQGNPFQNLQKNIDEVERSLQEQNDDLQSQIDDLVVDVEELAGDLTQEILDRAAAIRDLQDQLDEHAADDEAALADLSSQIDENRNELAVLLQATGKNADDIAALLLAIEANQDDIDQLEADLAILDAELALKQNDIDGICPDGEAAVEVLDDGTLVCEEVASAEVSIVTVSNTPTTSSHNHPTNHCHVEVFGICFDNHSHNNFLTHWSSSTTATCPAGSEVVGGGVDFLQDPLRASQPNGQTGWNVQRLGDNHDFYRVLARCLSVP